MAGLQATTPRRLGRDGLKPGTAAPDFTLSVVDGSELALSHYRGRRVLLTFTQGGCAACDEIAPRLARLVGDDTAVIIVNHGTVAATREWAQRLGLDVPVVAQEGIDLSRKYQAFATPFAFLIDEQGVIRSRGIVTAPRHVRFVLEQALAPSPPTEQETGPTDAVGNRTSTDALESSAKESVHA